VFETIALAFALSMDAFAVSIGLGARCPDAPRLALRCALYFGIAQGLMPVIGYLASHGALSSEAAAGWIDAWAPRVACLLLTVIGGKMILDGRSEGIEEDLAALTRRVFCLLALATSIDAMAAGFALQLLGVGPLLACLLIALVTALLSAIGAGIGRRGATFLEGRAEIVGGCVLILIGLRMLLL
jgi:putative Mn2+ efflux pump MntP